MTLLDVIVVMGTVELAALVAILAALVRPRADHSASGLARGVPGRAPVVHAGAGRAVIFRHGKERYCGVAGSSRTTRIIASGRMPCSGPTTHSRAAAASIARCQDYV